MKFRLEALFFVVFLLSAAAIVRAQHGDPSGGGMMAAMPTTVDTIRFAARVGDVDAACGILYSGIGTETQDVAIRDFRFYVNNVQLINAAGESVPFELTQDGLWQHETVALLDFEDGSSLCAEAGNAPMNTRLIGSALEGDYTGITFEVGVPFELNHLDQVTAPSPLNVAAMWWSWQFGYKFMRLDLTADSMPFQIHVGSGGCEASNGNTPPESPCANPNRVQVELDNFDPLRNFVVLDLAMLVDGVSLAQSVPQPPGCMSMVMDPDCVSLFPNLGVELETGDVLETAAFFRVE